MESTGYIVKWIGGTAYIGCTGKVEGADGDMWSMGKPLWMLKRMLKHRKLEYTMEPLKLCLMGTSVPIKEIYEFSKPKEKDLVVKEPECKS